MKNKICLLISFVVLAVVLGCNNADKKPVELSVIGENTASLAAIAKAKESFANQNKIIINTHPFEFATLNDKSNADLANGTGLYDVIMQYNFSLSSFVRNDYVYTLDELKKDLPDSAFEFESDLFQNDWREVGYYYDTKRPGTFKQVGYPFASNSMLLVYNKAMFNDAANKATYQKKYNQPLQIPTTWEQFYNVANFFTDKSKNTYGICIEGASTGELYYEFVNYLFSIGDGVMKKQSGWEGDINTPITLNTPNNLKALEFYLSLKPFNKGDYFNVDQPLQTKQVKEGNVAMAIMWSDLIYPQLYKSGDQEDNRFGYAPIPGNKSILGGGAFYVNKKSKDPASAFKFILWLLSEKNQVEMMKNGLCSPRKSVYDNPEVQSLPYVNALKVSLDRGQYMAEAGPDGDKISQIIINYVQKAWRNEIKPKVALQNMQQEIVAARSEIFKNVK